MFNVTPTHMQELPQHQKDIRWLFVWAKGKSLPPPNGDQATAFAERLAIMLHVAGLPEQEARPAAAESTFGLAPEGPRGAG